MHPGYVAICGAMLVASLCTPAAAQWKWRDKNNQVQYSDLPPPQGVPEASILQRPPAANRRALPAVAASAAQAAASATPAGLAAPKGVEPELEAKLRKEEQDKAAKAKAEAEKLAAQKADNCSRARNNLRGLSDGLRVARVNDKGEREFLDDKARAEEMGRNQATINADCN